MRKRKLIPLLIALAVVLALGIAVYLRSKAPPEAARLLPESDAIVYLQLKTFRTLTHFEQHPINRSPSLQFFIDATGIEPERDLDAIAVALHRVPSHDPPRNGRQPADIFTSEVFVGHFDGQRLAKFLTANSTSHEAYADRQIYTLPIDKESIRVAQLGYDTIGVSNMPTSEQMHSMIDRARASALSSPGSSLLASRYSDVPQLPLPPQAWAIGHIGLPFSQNGMINIMGLQLPLPEDTDLVASLRYSGSAHLRIEEIAPTPEAASRTIETLTTLLNLLKSLGNSDATPMKTPEAEAMRDVLNSITFDQHESRALLNATANDEQLKALSAAHNPLTTPDP